MMVQNGNAEIAVETFGNAADPSVLLIMGAMASMLWWPDRFCETLAWPGRYVIRYDNRDTGLSTTWPAGEPGYGFADMAADGIAILDALGIEAAHVVGMSAGGMIAQLIALHYPDRVASLTAISTSPLGIDGLPPPTEAYSTHSETAASVDWGDRADVVGFMLRECKALASTVHPFDEAGMKVFIGRDFDRARSFESATNHFLLPGGDDKAMLRAKDIRAPVLVIHGTSDPIFPMPHGEAFANALPDAKLLRIAGGGHELHVNDWPIMIDAILDHTSAVRVAFS